MRGPALPHRDRSHLIARDTTTAPPQRGRSRDEREYAARSIDQFLKEWIGAGMRPPRVTKASQLVWFTGMIGA